MAFKFLAKCRHVVGIRASEHEVAASPGVVEDQLLGNCAALRVAEHGGRVNAQMVEQICQVRGKLRSVIRRWKSLAPPVAAQVGNDHAMSGREMLDHWLEHLATDHQSMHEQEGRPRSALAEVEEFWG